MTSPMMPNSTATIIIAGTAILIEQLPNMVEAVLKIKRLLEAEGVEVRLVNTQALEASTETLRLIDDWNAQHNTAR